MKVLILGAGKVGLGVANYLKTQGVDITVIEKSEEIAFKLRHTNNIDVINGDALDIDILRSANAENTNLLIATMQTDEANMIACKIAQDQFNIKTKIARIRSKYFSKGELFDIFLKESFGVDIAIRPEIEISKNICDIVSVQGAFDIINLDDILIVGIKCLPHTDILNTPLVHFNKISQLNFFIVTIKRDGNVFFANDNSVLLEGDEIYVALKKHELHQVLTLFGYVNDKHRNILVIGGGSYDDCFLSFASCNKNLGITIIDKTLDGAEKKAQKFPGTNVILGDGLDYNLLSEICVDIDTAIVFSNKDRANILSSLMLSKLNVSRIISLCNNLSYKELLNASPHCYSINSNYITISSIISKSRKGNISSVFYLNHNLIDIVSVVIDEDCFNIGKRVYDVAIDNIIMPICVVRNEEVQFFCNDLCFAAHDVVLLAVAKGYMKEVETFFSSARGLKLLKK